MTLKLTLGQRRKQNHSLQNMEKQLLLQRCFLALMLWKLFKSFSSSTARIVKEFICLNLSSPRNLPASATSSCKFQTPEVPMIIGTKWGQSNFEETSGYFKSRLISLSTSLFLILSLLSYFFLPRTMAISNLSFLLLLYTERGTIVKPF